jgi:hypothetical protein
MMRPMVFYLAHGEADACGPGCNEWIAAEGKIDADAASRLRHLLAQLKGKRPPIFFYSPGGSVNGSMDLGRLLRAQKLTVSVAHTVALGCNHDQASAQSSAQTCTAQIRAGQPVEAQIDPTIAMCNSGCVYVVGGGAVRLIPPWVTLGIHDIGFDPALGPVPHNADVAVMAKWSADMRLAGYLRDMGIDHSLLGEASAIPHETMGRLQRTELVRLGFDRRDFGETVWQFIDKSTPTMRKAFFVRTDNSQLRYVNALVNLNCGKANGGGNVLVFGRERLNTDADAWMAAAQPAVTIGINGQDVRFVRVYDANLYVRAGQLSAATLDTVSDDTTIALPAAEFGRQLGLSGDVTLSMIGFSAAFAKLQKACALAKVNAPVTPPPQTVSAPPSIPRSAEQSMQGWGPLPTLSAKPLAPGATRTQVDSTLGAPTKTVGNLSLYSYTSSDNERKVMAAYFYTSGRLQRFARYAFKDGRIVDELSQAELTAGTGLNAIRSLLTAPNTAKANWPILPLQNSTAR